MVQYRRNRVAGGTYFFTVTLRDRRSAILVEHVDLLREAFRAVRRSRPFSIDAVVVLPDHLHAIWTLPAGDHDFSGRWRAIKSTFIRLLRKRGVDLKRNARREYDLWQRRYWERTLRNDEDYARHVDYIHYNPVKHGLVNRAGDWKYSSFHRYVRLGLLPQDWASEPAEDRGNRFGE
jgi:putative transposase